MIKIHIRRSVTEDKQGDLKLLVNQLRSITMGTPGYVAGETLTRLGLDATVITADASNTDNWWDGNALDAILLDAPCSASGVIRRHPDIKLLRRNSDIASLAALQSQLLEQLCVELALGCFGHRP